MKYALFLWLPRCIEYVLAIIWRRSYLASSFSVFFISSFEFCTYLNMKSRCMEICRSSQNECYRMLRSFRTVNAMYSYLHTYTYSLLLFWCVNTTVTSRKDHILLSVRLARTKVRCAINLTEWVWCQSSPCSRFLIYLLHLQSCITIVVYTSNIEIKNIATCKQFRHFDDNTQRNCQIWKVIDDSMYCRDSEFLQCIQAVS